MQIDQAKQLKRDSFIQTRTYYENYIISAVQIQNNDLRRTHFSFEVVGMVVCVADGHHCMQ